MAETGIKPASWWTFLALVHRRGLSGGRSQWWISPSESRHQQDGETTRGETGRGWGSYTFLL